MSTTDTSIMKDTRRKSDRLSTKTVVYFNDDEEIDQDVESVPAAAPDIKGLAISTDVASQVVLTQPKPILEPFFTKAKLQDGFCIVRKLGNGKYELVNLSKANLTHLGSEETGRQIKSSPELLNLLDISDIKWGKLKLKTNQAVASASKFQISILQLSRFMVIADPFHRVKNLPVLEFTTRTPIPCLRLCIHCISFITAYTLRGKDKARLRPGSHL